MAFWVSKVRTSQLCSRSLSDPGHSVFLGPFPSTFVSPTPTLPSFSSATWKPLKFCHWRHDSASVALHILFLLLYLLAGFCSHRLRAAVYPLGSPHHSHFPHCPFELTDPPLSSPASPTLSIFCHACVQVLD